MAIIIPPEPLPLRGAKWRLSTPSQVNRSGWTGTSKVVGLPGAQLWTVEAEFRTIIGEGDAKKWRAFFLSLRGQQNSFPVLAGEAQQTAQPNAIILGGQNAGNAIVVSNLPQFAQVLETGDFITFRLPSGHQRLVGLTKPLFSDGNGQGLANFEPELGEVPADHVEAEIRRPWALMRLTSEPPGWDVDVGQIYSFRVSAEEAR